MRILMNTDRRECLKYEKEGFELSAKQHFCLVIMDIFLTETDGFELLKAMRQSKTIPILILSSKAESKRRVADLKAGASGYLKKPYDLEECLAHAQSLMELYTQLHTTESRCYTLAFGLIKMA